MSAMKSKTKQLEIFDSSYPKKVDLAIKDFQSQMFSYKWLALLTEISVGKDHPSFGRLKTAALEFGKLLKLLSPYSGNYKGYSSEAWDRLSAYDPYYAALETRSFQDLHRQGQNLDRSSKSLIMRFKPILDSRGTPAKEITDEIVRITASINQHFKESYKYEY